MISFAEKIAALEAEGYANAPAMAKLAHDIVVSTKLDIGVHVHRQMAQKPMRFAIVLDESSATLPANSKEQIFAEKLKSLLRLGARSTRQKDVFDLCYLADKVDRVTLRRFIALLVFNDESMRENDFASIRSRVHRIFGSQSFIQRLSGAGANWIKEPPHKVRKTILSFLETLEN